MPHKINDPVLEPLIYTIQLHPTATLENYQFTNPAGTQFTIDLVLDGLRSVMRIYTTAAFSSPVYDKDDFYYAYAHRVRNGGEWFDDHLHRIPIAGVQLPLDHPEKEGELQRAYNLGFYNGHAFFHVGHTDEIYGFNPYSFYMVRFTFERLAGYSLGIGPLDAVNDGSLWNLNAVYYKHKEYDAFTKEQNKFIHYLWGKMVAEYKKAEEWRLVYLQSRLLKHTVYGYVTKDYFHMAAINRYTVIDAEQYSIPAAIMVMHCHNNRVLFRNGAGQHEEYQYMKPMLGEGVYDDWFDRPLRPYFEKKVDQITQVPDTEELASTVATTELTPTMTLRRSMTVIRVGIPKNTIMTPALFTRIAKRMRSSSVGLRLIDRVYMASVIDQRYLRAQYDETMNVQTKVDSRIKFMLIHTLFAIGDIHGVKAYTAVIEIIERYSSEQLEQSIRDYLYINGNRDLRLLDGFINSHTFYTYIERMLELCNHIDYIPAIGTLARKIENFHIHQDPDYVPRRRQYAGVIGEFTDRGRYLEENKDRPNVVPPYLEEMEQLDGVRFLRTVGEVYDEGEHMQHCVRIYSSSAVQGNCFLFHVNHTGYEATVMVTDRHEIVQCYGPENVINQATYYARAVMNPILKKRIEKERS